MLNENERSFFLERGYLHVPGILREDRLAHLQNEFDRVWEAERSPVSRSKLLKHRAFIDLIEDPPILERHRALFGRQTQLLQYDLLRQTPGSDMPERYWHRDFVFPGDHPLAVNTLLYFDDITEERGPTFVLPGSHRGGELPPQSELDRPFAGEVAVCPKAGDAVFINGAIWHSGGRNASNHLRRTAYLYYGYWWLKRYNEHEPIPTQAYVNADDRRLELLGLKMPDWDQHMYGQERREGYAQRRSLRGTPQHSE